MLRYMISKKIREMIIKEKPNLRHATSINAFGSHSLSVFDNVSHTLIAGVHGVDSSHFVVVEDEEDNSSTERSEQGKSKLQRQE